MPSSGIAAAERPALRVLVVGQTPPPHHGQAVAIRSLVDAEYDNIEIRHVRMAFSSSIEEVGRFRIRKLFHLAGIVLALVRARVRFRPKILYYPPAGPDLVPFLRDVIILTATRWLFPMTVFHFHAGGLSELYERLPAPLGLAFRVAYGRPEAAILPSELNPRDDRAVAARKTFIVPYGIQDECEQFVRRRRGDAPVPIVLFIGLLTRSKGTHVLLDAARLLYDRGVSFRVQFMGSFPSDEEARTFRARVEKNGLGHVVELLGQLTGREKRLAIRDAHIFCFPTFYERETFGIVLLEAMQCSLPVVATHWRGTASIVVEGETGLLVPPEDSVALADGLEKLVTNPDEAARMGENGRRRFREEYSLAKFLRRMNETLLDVAGG